MTHFNATSTMRILIADDDKKLCRLIADYLEPMGYEVEAAHSGLEGLEKIRINKYKYHAVILDVMMPGMDGFEVLRQIRMISDVPVLMLTARDEETDRIVGLEMGADDYLPKTFSSRELLARLRAVTRRYNFSSRTSKATPPMENGFVYHGLEIEFCSHSVYLDQELLPLTPIEYDLLVSLAKAAGRVLTRDQLLAGITGRSYEGFDRSVDVHISSLRRKLKEDPRNPRFIQTIRGTGYMFKKNG